MVVMTETRGCAERTHCAPSSGCVGSWGVQRLGDVVTEPSALFFVSLGYLWGLDVAPGSPL